MVWATAEKDLSGGRLYLFQSNNAFCGLVARCSKHDRQNTRCWQSDNRYSCTHRARYPDSAVFPWLTALKHMQSEPAAHAQSLLKSTWRKHCTVRTLEARFTTSLVTISIWWPYSYLRMSAHVSQRGSQKNASTCSYCCMHNFVLLQSGR